jgi:hypothetical protein
MTAPTPDQLEGQTITPPQLARRWGVDAAKINELIKTGQLTAVNLALDPRGRPRYRIFLADIQKFLEARSTKPTPRAVRPSRRRSTMTTKDYF